MPPRCVAPGLPPPPGHRRLPGLVPRHAHGLCERPAEGGTQRASFQGRVLRRSPGAWSTPAPAQDRVPGPRRAPALSPVLSLPCHARSLVKSEMKIDPHELFLAGSAGCCAQHVLGLFSLVGIFFSLRSLSFSPPFQRFLSGLGLLSPSPALNDSYSLQLVGSRAARPRAQRSAAPPDLRAPPGAPPAAVPVPPPRPLPPAAHWAGRCCRLGREAGSERLFCRDLLTSLGSVSDKVFRIGEETSCCGAAQLLQRRAASLPAGLGTQEEGTRGCARAAATAQPLGVPPSRPSPPAARCSPCASHVPCVGTAWSPRGGLRHLPQDRCHRGTRTPRLKDTTAQRHHGTRTPRQLQPWCAPHRLLPHGARLHRVLLTPRAPLASAKKKKAKQRREVLPDGEPGTAAGTRSCLRQKAASTSRSPQGWAEPLGWATWSSSCKSGPGLCLVSARAA